MIHEKMKDNLAVLEKYNNILMKEESTMVKTRMFFKSLHEMLYAIEASK